MAKTVIIAESGSDIPAGLAAELGIRIVPMHVSIGDRTIDDGDMDPAEMLEDCRQLVVMPHTSSAMPGDYARVFDEVHDADPEAKIVVLAYSAVTTCSYDNALTAAEGRDYVFATDTAQVTIGQGIIVTGAARWLAEHPGAGPDELIAYADGLAASVQMAFIPGDLGYLRAGGRLSNVAFLGATLLKIKPVIQIVDGRLVATGKLRGSKQSAVLRLIDIVVEQGAVDLERIFFVRSPGLPLQIQEAAEKHARDLGFGQVSWFDTGNVITSHCGPGTFGLALVQK